MKMTYLKFVLTPNCPDYISFDFDIKELDRIEKIANLNRRIRR